LNGIKRNKANIYVVLTTLLISATILYFNVYRFYGYKVSIGTNTITFVKSKIEFDKTYKKLQSEIKSKYKSSFITKDFTLSKVKVDDVDVFASGDNLEKKMLENFNIVVDVLIMKSDNKKMAYVVSVNQGQEILNSLKNYYKGVKLESVSKIEIENKISYENVKVKTGNLYENPEIVKEVIRYNNKEQTPLITVKVVGNKSAEQIIYPTTIMKSSTNLMSGVNKVEHEGSNGVKKVTTQVILYNNKLVSEKVLKSEITTTVQNKEILVGINKPILQLASINSPSRGNISSNYGMRWGKMHKGIDIAADFGSTINAALGGIVRYAAWEDGYGNVIKIDHGDGIEITYAHCSVITVKKGDVVDSGMKIGEVGSTGNSTGPHLHFEVRENGEAINPEKYIK